MELTTEKRIIRGTACLVPASAHDLERLEHVRAGRPLRTEVSFARSGPHHRWYWALVGVVADGLGMPRQQLHCELKLKAGLIKSIMLAGKTSVVELESTSFAAMDEGRFSEYVSVAVEIIFRDFLPGVRRGPVFKQVEALVGPRPPMDVAT